MQSRDPWDTHRLINLLSQTRDGEPRALLLAHSLLHQFQAVDIEAMARLHGSSLSNTDRECLGQILQASQNHSESASWWLRFTRLTLPWLDLRMKSSGRILEIDIHVQLVDHLDDRLRESLHEYLLHFACSRLINGFNELGFLDAFSPAASSHWQLELPESQTRPGTIPATRARQQCHELLALMPGSETDLGVKILTWLFLQPDHPEIDVCARAFDTSPRTLNRKLAMLGLKYNALLEHVRSVRALNGLQSNQPAWQVAEQLGYDNQANFGRACRRWFGHSPKQLKQMLNPPPQQELSWD